MFRLAFLTAVLCVPHIALAEADRVELNAINNPSNPIPESGIQSGQAVLNFAQGEDKTIVQVNCWGLLPGETYTVFIKPGGVWRAIGVFTTAENGSGHLHVEREGDLTNTLPVAVNGPANFTVLADSTF